MAKAKENPGKRERAARYIEVSVKQKMLDAELKALKPGLYADMEDKEKIETALGTLVRGERQTTVEDEALIEAIKAAGFADELLYEKVDLRKLATYAEDHPALKDAIVKTASPTLTVKASD